MYCCFVYLAKNAITIFAIKNKTLMRLLGNIKYKITVLNKRNDRNPKRFR